MTTDPRATDPVPLHRRSIQYEAFDGGETMVVVGTLCDTRPWAEDGRSILIVHDMDLRVEVAVDDLTITEASAQMRTFPHVECPAITADLIFSASRRAATKSA